MSRKGFACLVAGGFVVRQLQEVLDGPSRRRQDLLRLGVVARGRLGASLGWEAVGAGAADDGAEPDADSGGEEALVVAGERPGDVDGLVAVAAEERPVLHAEDEGRPLLADVATREPRCRGAVEREALVLAGHLVGGVDLDVAARAQRRLVRAAHHGGGRGPARVALDPHLRVVHQPSPTSRQAIHR
jgi:hypothetical protein